MSEPLVYVHHGRSWCIGGNTVPSTSERDEALANDRWFECGGCGRRLRLKANGLVPGHLARARAARGEG